MQHTMGYRLSLCYKWGISQNPPTQKGDNALLNGWTRLLVGLCICGGAAHSIHGAQLNPALFHWPSHFFFFFVCVCLSQIPNVFHFSMNARARSSSRNLIIAQDEEERERSKRRWVRSIRCWSREFGVSTPRTRMSSLSSSPWLSSSALTAPEKPYTISLSLYIYINICTFVACI